MKPRRAAGDVAVVYIVAVLAAASPTACSGEPVQPGFEEVSGGAGVGGSGGDAGGEGATGPMTTSGSGGPASGSGSGSASSGAGEGGTGGDGGSGGNGCTDTGAEPNETEATATDLGMITDNNGSGLTVSGVLSGPTDVDWYFYLGDDVAGSVVDPTRQVAAAYPTQICIYVDCENGTATFTCPVDTSQDVSPAGHPGCCSLKGFSIKPDCDGIDDNATVLVRVGNPDGNACIPYTLELHY